MICPYKIPDQECEGAECPMYSPDMTCLKTYDFVVYKEEDVDESDDCVEYSAECSKAREPIC